MDKTEKCIKENLIYKGKILSLFRDEVKVPSGNISYREIVRHNGGVCALAVHNNEIYFGTVFSIFFTMITIYILAFLFSHTQIESILFNNNFLEKIGL